MSTPEIPASNIVQSKYSPFCNGINKSLLTPCRQIGLSRKRKTPLGSLSKHFSEDLNRSNTSINSTNSFSESETTPLTHTKISNRRRRLDNLSPACSVSRIPSGSENKLKRETDESREYVCSKKTKRELLRTFTSEDLFDSNDDIPCSTKNNESSKNIEKVTDCSNIANECISDIGFMNDEEVVPIHIEYKNKNEIRKDTVISPNKFIEIQQNYLHDNSNIQNMKILGNDSDDDFVISKGSQNIQKKVKDKKLKSVKKNLPQKKSSETNFSKSNSVNELRIQLEKLSEADVTCMESNSVDEICVQTISRKCSSNAMDLDGDFFTSTPEEEKLKRKNLERKMKTLESEIKQKRSLLENLERAAIYKGKHNIQELKRLTSIWLEGCGQALKDLLTHLQAHSSISLNTLLNNMKIPEEIVAKLTVDRN